MKMDTDSILYIVITLVILVISGLSSKRKKKAQMEAQAAEARKRDDEFEGDEEEYYEPEAYEEEPEPAPMNIFETLKSASSTVTRQSSNPFEKLEQFMGGQNPFSVNQDPRVQGMEGESLEDTIDEEEQILEDIRKRRENEPTSPIEKEPVDEPENDYTLSEDRKKEDILELFGNVNEIKKAVIYSEILNRKY